LVDGSQHEEAMEYFKQLKRDGYAPDGQLYTLALKALAGIGGLKRMYAIVDEMKSKNFRAGQGVHGAFFDAFVFRRQLARLTQYWAAIPDHDRAPSLYNKIVYAMSILGATRQLTDIVQEMKGKNLTPNKSAYRQLIRAYLRRGEYEQADALINEGVASGLNTADEFNLDKMHAKCGQGQTADLEKSYRADVQEKKDIPKGVYFSLIRGYTQAGKPDSITRLLEEMRQQGKGDLVTEREESSFIRAHYNAGSLDKAIQAFEGLRKKGTPSVMSYNQILRVFKDAKKDDLLHEYHEKMKQDGVVEDIRTQIILGTAPPRPGDQEGSQTEA